MSARFKFTRKIDLDSLANYTTLGGIAALSPLINRIVDSNVISFPLNKKV
jgi:outer membrane scaffolding protein for murein synthesis (MipA/OmpV family)